VGVEFVATPNMVDTTMFKNRTTLYTRLK